MKPAANATRGEITLALEGQPYVLRPSFEAIQAFETATGKSIIDLARSALAGALTTGDAAIIAAECIRAWGRANDDEATAHFNARRVGELMFEADDGVTGAMKAIAEVLAWAATGGYTAQGEVRPGTATK